MKNNRMVIEEFIYQEKRAVIEGKPGHHYLSEFAHEEEMYCPHCGARGDVWSETGLGDYYLGNKHICTCCSHRFYIPHEPSIDERSKAIARQIRNCKPDEPKTPRGE